MASKSVDVVIRGIASGGAGVGDLPDGRVIFVPRTTPGDQARVRIEKSKARWAVGSLQRLLQASPDRVKPLCALYEACGGCQLQHLPYERQLEAKARFISDSLQRIGGLGEVEHPEIVSSPRTEGYRNRVTYTLRRLPKGYVVAGFHALAKPAHVIDVAGQCVLPSEGLSRVWLKVRAGWGEGARNLPDAGRLRLTLRESVGGVELVVEGGPVGWDPKPLRNAVPELVAVWHDPSEEGQAPSLVGGESGPGGGTAFGQVNPEAADLLRAYVMEVANGSPQADDGSPGRAIDAYCGVGEYGRALASSGWITQGIEVDPAAVREANSGGPAAFTAEIGRVEERLGGLLPADLLILNPPRSGLNAEVPPIILAQAPPRIVYVSCDPATLARDLGALSDGYEVHSIRAFDLFPHTSHVETVAVLVRRRASE
ncbi:MAG: TRAM domain-containing protein [Gemmatimonadetes bacterium]|nr:TRAM domain-containing protein [Gemmatimonadota bacterium]MDA1104709.1 TRAM domain-containing protein [Gemmatimonadota bacterium]